VQGKDIADAPRVQTEPKGVVLSIETIRHYRPEGGVCRYRLQRQRQCNLRFGAKRRIVFAARKPMRRGVRFDIHGIVDPFIRPERANRDDTIVDLTEVAEILSPDMCRLCAVLAIPRLVNHQRTIGVRSGRRQGTYGGKAGLIHSRRRDKQDSFSRIGVLKPLYPKEESCVAHRTIPC